jgi:hypothetical protein
MKYKNPELDFVNNLEVPNAKTVDKPFLPSTHQRMAIVLQMKMHGVMKDSWQINNFPFDEQKLRVSIENSQYDTSTYDICGRYVRAKTTTNVLRFMAGILTVVSSSTGNKVYKTVLVMRLLSKTGISL